MKLPPRRRFNADIATYDYSRGRDHFVDRGVPVGNVKTLPELIAALNGHLSLIRDSDALTTEIRAFMRAHGYSFLAQSKSRS